MKITRRKAMQSVAVTASVAAVRTSAAFNPAAAPTSSPSPRMPLSEFLKTPRLLKALRRGVEAMKKRKPYDPFSWFYQAAIHGVLPAVVMSEREKLNDEDADKLDAVFQKRYWNQCPHNGEEAANFLPWHRAYTHYFEKILRLHTEEDDFSLPFWDYEPKENRKFPKEFGEPFVGGDPEKPNPLFLKERDYYFTRYDHKFAVGLPLLELTDAAVDSSLTLATPVFFGESETQGLGGGYADESAETRGMLESRPHDHIHRAVGGIIPQPNGEPALGAMSQPPTAGFDPIFPFHHSNIDRLWAVWTCMPGKSWGKLPPSYWFNERPWFFWDVGPGDKPQVVNEPRKNYFDYRALGVRFEGVDPKHKHLELPKLDQEHAAMEVAQQRRKFEVLAYQHMPLSLAPLGRSVIHLKEDTKTRLSPQLKEFRSARAQNAAQANRRQIFLRLVDTDLGFVPATGFDIHVTSKSDTSLRRGDKSFVGSIALFRHQLARSSQAAAGMEHEVHGGGEGHAVGHGSGEMFEISDAVADIGDADLAELKVVVVPYALLTVPGKDTVFATGEEFHAAGVQFLVAR